MRPSVSVTIPQPCSENWAAMLPTAAGRYCEACAKTVVDFTQQTDTKILAYLARAASGRTCGRFVAGQLERPLQRAAPAAPMVLRWRAWLAAAVVTWSTYVATASLPVSFHKSDIVNPRTWLHGRPSMMPRYVSGTVRDSVTRQPVKGGGCISEERKP